SQGDEWCPERQFRGLDCEWFRLTSFCCRCVCPRKGRRSVHVVWPRIDLIVCSRIQPGCWANSKLDFERYGWNESKSHFFRPCFVLFNCENGSECWISLRVAPNGLSLPLRCWFILLQAANGWSNHRFGRK